MSARTTNHRISQSRRITKTENLPNMNEELFNKLTASLRQMKAIRAGTLQPSRVTKLAPDHPAAVRSRLRLTQPEFAEMIGVSLGTLRNWEQGHREPTGPARALLRIAATYPKQAALALGHTGTACATHIGTTLQKRRALAHA
jgi:putative transcriptional regulator